MPPRSKAPGLLESLAAEGKRRSKVAKAEAKAAALLTAAAADEQEANKDKVETPEGIFVTRNEEPSIPSLCSVAGLNHANVSVKTQIEFMIQSAGNSGPRTVGGEGFFVAVRGASRARVRIGDCGDGRYKCTWQADTSGRYFVMVSLFGESIAGSPFPVVVFDPSPHASKCEVTGDHLYTITARTPSAFEVHFRDRAGCMSQAVDLDVYVESILEGGGEASEADSFVSDESRGLDELPYAMWECATKQQGNEAGVNNSQHGGTTMSKLSDGGTEGDRPARASFNNSSRRGRSSGSKAKLQDDGAGQGERLDGAGGIASALAGGDIAAEPPPDFEDDGYGSTDEVFDTFADAAATRRRAFPVKVGANPLQVRKGQLLNSEPVAQLLPGQYATVIEERITQGGKHVRALLLFDQLLSSSRKWKPGDHPSSVQTVLSEEPNDYAASMPSSSPCLPSSPHSPIEKQSPPSPAEKSREHLMMMADPIGGGGEGVKEHQSLVLRRKNMPDSPKKGGLSERKATQRLAGWATLRKNGRNLVTSRVRLDVGVRRSAGLLWKLQALNDRLQLDLQTEAALLDPTGVGFAFGGVHPGQLHSKGIVQEAHKVAFSVDRVGRYLLHVRLRQQARSVPGSPFALVVRPGDAHQSSSKLLLTAIPLTGEVGINTPEGPKCGCSIVLRTNDRVGNPCAFGGATVKIDNSNPNAESHCEDHQDGTYTITWTCKVRGSFESKVSINKEQVQGSPVRIQLTSSTPEVSKTIVSGSGLKSAVAGQPSQILLTFVDIFGNACSPNKNFTIGLAMAEAAMVNSKNKLNEMQFHSNYTSTWRDAATGEMEVTYVPSVAATCELHLWWARSEQPTYELTATDDGAIANSAGALERTPFPGSPFSVHVVSGEPVAECSYLAGWSVSESKTRTGGKEGKSKSTEAKPQAPAPAPEPSANSSNNGGLGATSPVAGGSVSVRIHGVDKFNNTAVMQENDIVALVVSPNGTETPLSILGGAKTTPQQKDGNKAATGKTQFEFRYEAILSGSHELRAFLNGEHVKGSPIEFTVLPSAAIPQQSRLVAPESDEPLVADLDTPATAHLVTGDKYGNPCVTGGLRVAGRLMLTKQGQSENTILMPNNHTVHIEDLENGSYAVHVSLAMPCTVRLIVNMDKDLPAQGGELPPLQMTFGGSEPSANADRVDAEAPLEEVAQAAPEPTRPGGKAKAATVTLAPEPEVFLLEPFEGEM